jgi:hypothetical protein
MEPLSVVELLAEAEDEAADAEAAAFCLRALDEQSPVRMDLRGEGVPAKDFN